MDLLAFKYHADPGDCTQTKLQVPHYFEIYPINPRVFLWYPSGKRKMELTGLIPSQPPPGYQ